MSEGFDVSIVVPTYNERERLEDLVRETLRVFSLHGLRGEVVIVDDNSPDGTGDLADRLAQCPEVRVVHRAGKLGLGSAVVAGFKVARASVLGVMDADLSHPPSLLPALLGTLQTLNVDMAVGSRYIPGGGCRNWPLRRRVLSRLGCWLARPLTPVRDVTSGFFLARRSAIEHTVVSAPGFKICLELLVRAQVAAVAEVPFVFVDRAAGKSKMTWREALNYFVQLKDLYLLAGFSRRRSGTSHLRLSPEEIRPFLAPPVATAAD